MTKGKPTEAENGERYLSQISSWNYASIKVANDTFFCLEKFYPEVAFACC